MKAVAMASLSLSRIASEESDGYFWDLSADSIHRTTSELVNLHTHYRMTQKLKHHVGICFLKSEHHPDFRITWPFRTVAKPHNRWCLPPGPGCRTSSKEAAAHLLSLPLSFWIKTIMLMRAMGPGQPTLASAGQL